MREWEMRNYKDAGWWFIQAIGYGAVVLAKCKTRRSHGAHH